MSTITYGTPYKIESQQSLRNKQAVLEAVIQRFPAFAADCIPYVNVLTFHQWKARGFHVKKGEHAIRIPVLREIEEDDKKTKRLIRQTACLFALPQVERAA